MLLFDDAKPFSIWKLVILCERKCLVESKVVAFDEEFLAVSLIGKTSDEPIPNKFVDASSMEI